MKSKIAFRFLAASLISVFIAVFVLDFFVSLQLSENVESKIIERLESNAILVGEILKDDISASNTESVNNTCKLLAEKLQVRITVIASDGAVWADSEGDLESMENHLDRPEIKAALTEGFGTTSRPSPTLGYEMKYVAVRIGTEKSGLSVVRLAMLSSHVRTQMMLVYRAVMIGGIASVMIAALIGYFVSKQIARPIMKMKQVAEQFTKGNFDTKIRIRRKDELGDLGHSLNTMASELQGQIESLKRMGQMRTDFVANVSHELKTPLTSIKGFIETLEYGGLEDKENAKRFITIIKKHADRLENIVNDLLTLSELENFSDSLDKKKFDLKKLIEETVMGFGRSLEVRNQNINITADAEDFTIVADRDRLEQVFVNLIDNAIKYSSDGKIIQIKLQQKGDSFVISVEDQGAGISNEHIGRVFERFYRVDKARSREVGGTGLGLGIAKHIVMAHSGTISIESKLGEGTKIHVIVPKQ